MSEFNQRSFRGGMNLLVDDTRLAEDEYREAFNLRNRFDVLDQIPVAVEQIAPAGKKQGIYSFGDYLLLFANGRAYYQFRDTVGWVNITGFLMSTTAPRFYLVAVPVNTTNYGRLAAEDSGDAIPNQPINLVNVSSALGNAPGILVQDGTNQPWFIWVSGTGIQARVTKKYGDWAYDPSGANDKREYVPVGTFMEWVNGVLFMVSPDFNLIYRSVSGRPLDFVVNITPDGDKGGDATTTAYSVGVGGITCLKALNDGSLFVSAGGVICFRVAFNTTPGAPTLFGEYTFTRQFLFNAGCLSEKCFVDILGDTAFIDPEGLRSFNAVLQSQNEGRNSIFSLKVSSLFRNLLQTVDNTASINFDNFALFAVNTIYGYVILVYDTLNQCYCGMDTQTNGVAIKQFAKIDTNVTQLYCITADDKVLKLYAGTTTATSTFRSQSVTSTTDGAGQPMQQSPKSEMKLTEFRCILSRFRQTSTVSIAAFVNNRLSVPTDTKTIQYVAPPLAYSGSPSFADVDSQVTNLLWTFANAGQGWKTFFVMSWTGGGSITNIYANFKDLLPMNPLKTQSVQTEI